MAYRVQSRERNVTLPSQYYTPSSQPSTPPAATNSKGNLRDKSPAVARTPHMIRCSTCMCLVALLDLSDHICRPPDTASRANAGERAPRDYRQRQYSANAQMETDTQNVKSTGLRVNIARAQQSTSSSPREYCMSNYVLSSMKPNLCYVSLAHSTSDASTSVTSCVGSFANCFSNSHKPRQTRSPRKFSASRPRYIFWQSFSHLSLFIYSI